MVQICHFFPTYFSNFSINFIPNLFDPSLNVVLFVALAGCSGSGQAAGPQVGLIFYLLYFWEKKTTCQLPGSNILERFTQSSLFAIVEIGHIAWHIQRKIFFSFFSFSSFLALKIKEAIPPWRRLKKRLNKFVWF